MTLRVFLLLLMCFPVSVLQAQEPLKLVYFNDFAPFSWQGSQQMQGIYVDILHEALAIRMKLNVTHQGFPWARAQALVKAHKADGFITVPTEQRSVYTSFSEDVLSLTTSIFVRKSHPEFSSMKKIQTIAELKGYVLVDYVGNGWASNALIDQNVHWLARFDQIFPYMVQGRGDAHVASRHMVNYNLKKLGFKGKIIELPHPVASLFAHLCLGKNSKYVDVLPEFNKVIKTMKQDGSIDVIFEKYQ